MLFFLECQTRKRKREAGVGFAIKTNIVTKLTQMPRPVSDRIMTMILPLSMQQLSACTFQQCQTQMKTRMPSTTTWQVCSVASLLLLLVFNTRIGRENDKYLLVMGTCGIGKYNSNGELLLVLRSEFELIVNMFMQKYERKTTWMHPRSKQWHMVDYIITRCWVKMDIRSSRAMLAAIYWTDRQMLMS